jgi:DNA ligase-1
MPLLLSAVVDASARVAENAGRLAKRDAIAACIRSAGEDEVEIVVAYLAGETRQGRIGIGYATLAALRGGHAGEPTLTVGDVDAALARIAAIGGKGSAAARSAELAALFARSTAAEQDFLVRLLVGELRQGALEGVMIEAIAAAAAVPVADVRRATMVTGSVAAAARVATSEGSAGLLRFAIALQRPVQPMLAQPADDVAGALAKLGTAAVEWKVDGARIQVHKAGDDIRVYTRALNDVTASVPEIVEALRAVHADELILDGEAVRARRRRHAARVPGDDASLRPQARRRAAARRAAARCVLLRLPAARRRVARRPSGARALRCARGGAAGALVVPRLVTADAAAAADFYADALARGHEGVMVKALDAPYEAGSRGAGWLKVKRAHTLDLVVLAAEWGHGRRHGWLSNLHLGARDPAGGWVMLGKTFKGMTDAMLEWQTHELLARETSRDAYTVHVRPELVVEIAFNDLQASPHYPGGLALRFARVKGYRPDKRAEEADTIEAVRAVYDAQVAGAPR